MKLPAGLQAIKHSSAVTKINSGFETTKTATKKFMGRAVAKLRSVDLKTNLKKGLKAAHKMISNRKVTIKITIDKTKNQDNIKLTVKGDSSKLNLDGLTGILEKQLSESAVQSSEKDATTEETNEKPETPAPTKNKKPPVPPRPYSSSRKDDATTEETNAKPETQSTTKKQKPVVPPRPDIKSIKDKNLAKHHEDQPVINSNNSKPPAPPAPPIKNITTKSKEQKEETQSIKQTSKDNLLQEIRNFNQKKNLKKTNTNNQVKNTKSELHKSLEAAILKRRKSINPKD